MCIIWSTNSWGIVPRSHSSAAFVEPADQFAEGAVETLEPVAAVEVVVADIVAVVAVDVVVVVAVGTLGVVGNSPEQVAVAAAGNLGTLAVAVATVDILPVQVVAENP